MTTVYRRDLSLCGWFTGTNGRRLKVDVVYVEYPEELVPCQNPYCPTCTYGDPGALPSTKQACHEVVTFTLPVTVPTDAGAWIAARHRAVASDDLPPRPGIEEESYD